jgi:hypothetical protein
MCSIFDAHCFQILPASRIQFHRHVNECHADDPAVHQKRIQKATEITKKNETFNDDQKMVHWLVSANIPFAAVESESFRSICALNDVRARTTYARTVLPRMYLAMRREVEAVLRDQISLSVQTDSWSDAFTNSYFQGVTGWWLQNVSSCPSI